MPICPTCKISVEGDAQFCPRDGSPLAVSKVGDPLFGRVLGGRYRLGDRLGQGGMGTVYRAMHVLMDKPVAVKVLRADLAGDGEAVGRFHREARSASKLDHEHCIRVTDFGQSEDGLLYLVMELLEGETLSKALTRGPMDGQRTATIGHAVALALGHAHEQGVFHRDLKPDNVFLARRGRSASVVKVLDFGLAKIAADPAGGPSLTKAGVVFGTPQYMAPEQAEGQACDGRADIYGLGMIAYQMLTGVPAFIADNFLELLTKQVSEEPVPPRARRPDLDIPGELESIVLRCLEKDPGRRFQTATEVAAALAPFADLSVPSLSGPVPVPVVEPPSEAEREGPSLSMMSGEVLEKRHPLRRGFALGALALAGLGAFLAYSRYSRRPQATEPAVIIASRLEEARRSLANEDLDRAEDLLRVERAHRDGAEVQVLLGQIALLRGNRLGAMAHFHRATRIAPGDADPHARLASLLALIGQREHACQEADLALRSDQTNSMARGAKSAAQCR